MKRLFLFFTLLAVTLNVAAQEADIHYRVLHGYNNADARREIRVPDIMGYKTLKCDFHMHTIFSDGSVLPQERVKEAWREGLDVIAITDHSTPQPKHINGDYNSSYNMAKSTAQSKGITLIRGIEYTKSKPIGHLNFLFVDDANLYGDPSIEPQQAVEMAADRGAFVIYNHPGWPDKNSDLFDFQIDLMNQDKIHAIEVINSHEFYPIAMDHCYQYNLAPLSNTDIHEPIQATYNIYDQHRNLTLVFAKDQSQESVREALFDRRTVACAGNLLVGKELFLSELLRKSLIVSKYKESDGMYSCDVTNISDINYFFDGPNHTRITFPANRTVQLRDDLRSVNVIYKVSNTYINSKEHLEFPLHFIMTDEAEVAMPYLKQEVRRMSPDTKIQVFCPTPGAEIRYTLDGSEPTASSLLYSGPFVVEKSSPLSLRAFKPGMRKSRVFKVQALLDIPHSGEKLKSPRNGVHYSYYEGNIRSVREIEEKGRLAENGVAEFPDISRATAEDHFGMIFTGFIYAPSDGLYTFATQSDDGSTLSISGIDLIDNDGSHSLTKVSASIRLNKGYHPYELRFMEDYEGQELRFLWSRPGEKEMPVSPEFLFIKK